MTTTHLFKIRSALLTASLGGILTLPCALAEEPTWWEGAKPYEAPPRPSDGRHMTLTMEKITGKRKLDRPLLIWALGSSYTNFQGDGSELIGLIRERYPDMPEVVYKKQVGSAVPYEFLSGWVRHFVVADQPDVVIIYAIGTPEGLEKTIREIRAATTADIIVPTIHWRKQRAHLWGKNELPVDQKVPEMRVICEKYGVEFVENREEMTEFMKANGLTPDKMTFDSVHQNKFTRRINAMNTARHFNVPDKFSYDGDTRERRIEAEKGGAVTLKGFKPTADGNSVTSGEKGASIEVKFTGKRIDLIGAATPDGGSLRVLIDGKPAEEYPAFVGTFVAPQPANSKKRANEVAPHGVFIEASAVPQQWRITRTGEDDTLGFEIVGSVTGADGKGSALEPFTSTSGQIRMIPTEWRSPKDTKAGDSFVFEVKRTTTSPVSLRAAEEAPVRHRLAYNLPHGEHTITLIAEGDGAVTIDAFDVFQPPLESAREN